MSTKLDDVHLEVRIDVGKATRDSDKLDKKQKKKKQRTEREAKQKAKAKGGGFIPGVRGAGLDIARGQTPGIGRLGRGAAKVAGFLAMLKLIEVVADAASSVPILGELAKPVSRGLKTGKHQIASAFGAIEDTKNILLGRELAGKSASISDASRIFERERKTRITLGQADLARDIITAEFIAPIAAKALVGVFKSMLLSAMRDDPEVRRTTGEIIMDVILGPFVGPALRGVFR